MATDNNVDLNSEELNADLSSDNKQDAFGVDSFFSNLEKEVNGAVYDEFPSDNNEVEAQGGDESQEQVVPAGESADLAKDLENLQKRYDASSKESKRLAARLRDYEDVEDLLPVVRVIQQDPTLLKQVRSYLEEGASPASAVKDLNLGEDFVFDPDEAIKDPGSDSAKVLSRIVDARVQSRIAADNEARNSKARQQNSQERMFRDFQKEHNISDDELEEFVDWAKNESLSLEHLWHLKNREKRDQTILKGSLEDRQKQLDKMSNTPRSLGTTGAGNAPAKTAEEQVFDLIMNADNVNLLGE